VLLLAIIGVAQTVYVTINEAVSSKLAVSYGNGHIIYTTTFSAADTDSDA
jgi:hypothetical protein